MATRRRLHRLRSKSLKRYRLRGGEGAFNVVSKEIAAAKKAEREREEREREEREREERELAAYRQVLIKEAKAEQARQKAEEEERPRANSGATIEEVNAERKLSSASDATIEEGNAHTLSSANEFKNSYALFKAPLGSKPSGNPRIARRKEYLPRLITLGGKHRSHKKNKKHNKQTKRLRRRS